MTNMMKNMDNIYSHTIQLTGMNFTVPVSHIY